MSHFFLAASSPSLGSLSPKQNPFVSFSSEEFDDSVLASAKKIMNTSVDDLHQPGPSSSQGAPALYGEVFK